MWKLLLLDEKLLVQLIIRLTSPCCSIFDVYKDTLSPQIKNVSDKMKNVSILARYHPVCNNAHRFEQFHCVLPVILSFLKLDQRSHLLKFHPSSRCKQHRTSFTSSTHRNLSHRWTFSIVSRPGWTITEPIVELSKQNSLSHSIVRREVGTSVCGFR